MSDDIVLTDTPEPSAKEAILKHLTAFNTGRVGPSAWRLLVLLIRDDAGQVIGGLWGRTAWSWLFVELLFIPETLRGTGIGTQLMRRAEDEARSRGCHSVWLDTFSFQARGFYEKLGYGVFGTLEQFPPGHSRFFLQKRLDTPPAGRP